MSCGSAGMGLYNIAVKRNGTYRETFTFQQSDGSVIDMTGWDFEMQVRPANGSSSLAFTVGLVPNVNGSSISDDDVSEGKIEVFIANADINLVPEVSDTSESVSYAYDIVLTDTNGDFNPYIGGAFTVVPGVTE